MNLQPLKTNTNGQLERQTNNIQLIYDADLRFLNHKSLCTRGNPRGSARDTGGFGVLHSQANSDCYSVPTQLAELQCNLISDGQVKMFGVLGSVCRQPACSGSQPSVGRCRRLPLHICPHAG